MSASIAAISAPASASSSPSASEFGLADISFHDILSVINPLQHLPIVSTVYRAITGDTIKPLERIAGDALYGGLWGFMSSIANVAFQEITGKDFGDTAMAFLEGDDDDDKTQLAANAQPAAPTAAAAATQTAAASILPANASSPEAGAVLAPPPAAIAATAPPRPLQPQRPEADNAASLALLSAMNSRGIDPSVSQRALQAYSKSLSASPAETVPIF